MFLSREKIRNLADSERAYSKGLDYYNNNKIIEFEITGNIFTGMQEIYSEVEGSALYFVDIEINSKKEHINYTCTCPAHFNSEGACKHVVAALLYALYDNNSRYGAWQRGADSPIPKKIIKKTDNVAIKLIDRCINNDVSETQIAYQNKDELISLIPTIYFIRGYKAFLSLTVGNVRQYVVKNINEFCSNIVNKETIEYGKSLKFNHNIDSFEPKSKELARLLVNKFIEDKNFEKDFYYSRYVVDKKSKEITPVMMDEIFNIYENDIIKVDCNEYKQRPIALKTQNVKLKFNIIGDDDGILFICNDIYAISGEKYCYVINEDYLYRCDYEYKNFYDEILMDIIGNNSRMYIARKDMGKFFNIFIPKIEKFITIEGGDDYFEEFAPQNLEVELYMDLVNKNDISMELKYVYDDTKINSLDFSKYKDIKRNEHEEIKSRTIIEQIADAYPEDGYYHFTGNDSDIYDFITKKLPILGNNFEIFATEKFQNINIVQPRKSIVGVSVESDLLKIDISNIGFDLSELEGILTGYRQNKKFYRLKDGSFMELDDNAIGRIAELTDSLDVTKKQIENGEIIVPKHRALFIDALLYGDEAISFKRDNYFKELIRMMKSVADSDFAIPESLENVLRNYQQTGFRWLKTLEQCGFSGILADDMGLGKSLQIISALLDAKENGNKIPSLIICPTSLVLNWVDEFMKFAPNMKIMAINGMPTKRAQDIKEVSDYDVVITSYDHLKRDVEEYKNIEFYYNIIDEAQYIKNQTTVVAKSVKTINSKYRCALTGTPIENRISELWSIFDFLMPLYLHSYSKFKQKFETPAVKDNDQVILGRLNKMVAPFILRRMKKDVLKELPDKTEMVFYTDMEEEQKKLYLANVLKTKEEINEANYSTNKMAIFALLTRLRQLCCDPNLCYENYSGGSGKLEACMELVSEVVENGHKILLFSQFTSMLAIIEERLKKENISYYKLQGSTPKQERHNLVEKFNNDDTQVFLISLKAGGTGLNLTAADIVIHYDPWWNLAAQNQATDRAHRIGQQNKVTVYKLIAKDTIEENILKLQQNKIDLVDTIIQEGDGILSAMTREELFELF